MKCLPKDDYSQDSSTRLAKLAQIFHLLGTNCQKNIDTILERTCHVFDGACSLYNRIDDRQKSLLVWASHNSPEDLSKCCDATGHICWEATIKGENQPVVIDDIEQTEFYLTDPYVKQYKLKSYLGFPVRCRNQTIGSLCIVDTKSRCFTHDDIHCIQTLAAALSLEEERLSLEQTLVEQKKRYQTLIENADDAIYIIQDECIKFPNPKMAQLSGYTLEELDNMPFTRLVHPDDRERVQENYFNRLKGEDVSSTYSFKAVDKFNNSRLVQINAVPVQWENRPAVLYFSRDITRLKEMEEKLQRAEKMELIGTMAGGVAHDLNNILSALVSYPELLLMQLEDDSPLKEPISFMFESGLKAADIVQDLLTLTRPIASAEKIINLNQIVKDYLHSVAYLRLCEKLTHVEFKDKLDAELLNLKGSPSHLTKILMNLVINAAEAIEDKGFVSIETCNRHVDTPLTGYETVPEGDYVVLKVTDNGIGIRKDEINQIFEPFFSSKHLGQSGSGLGLSVVWNSVKDHKGYIQVNSCPNKGTVFELYFPASREASDKTHEHFNLEDFKGHGEAILVVDDKKEQRKIARDILYQLGYQPITVASGEKALQFIQHYAADLLLLDMIMDPGMDGLDTYRAILTINPSQRAIIASGFSENERVKQAIRMGAGQYIKKPYTIRNLAQAIKKELAIKV